MGKIKKLKKKNEELIHLRKNLSVVKDPTSVEAIDKEIEKNRHKIELKTAIKKIKLANEVIDSCWSMLDFNKTPKEQPYKTVEYFKGGLELVDMYNSLENIKRSGNIDGLIIENATLVRKAGECSRYELTVTYLNKP